jgi:DNA topoisomerase-1
LNGRYGPYITDGEKNARIPKDRDPKSLTEAECAELLAAAPVRPKRGGRFGNRGKGAPAKADAAAPIEARAAKKATAKKTAAKKPIAKKAAAKKAAKKTAAKKSPAA